MAKQGGTQANLTGKELEKYIENHLINADYTFVHKKKFEPAIYLEQPIYSKQVFISRSIYDTPTYPEGVKWKSKGGMTPYAWFVWDKGHTTEPVIRWIKK